MLAHDIGDGMQVIAYATTCAIGVVAIGVYLARRSLALSLADMASRWFATLVGGGALMGLTGDVAFGLPGDRLEAIGAGAAFGMTALGLEILLEHRSKSRDSSDIRIGPAILAVTPLFVSLLR